MLADWTTAPVGPKLAAALALLNRMTREPGAIDERFVRDLGNHGLTTELIEAASTVAFRYAIINRAADVFAFPLPSERSEARTARFLWFMNWSMRFQPPSPLFVRGGDGQWRPTDVETARTQFLEAPGSVSPQLRSAVEARAARWFGATRTELDLPEHLMDFVARVATAPASADDALIDQLREHGYDDEGIFELTMAVSLGVACAGVEPLAAILREGQAAS